MKRRKFLPTCTKISELKSVFVRNACCSVVQIAMFAANFFTLNLQSDYFTNIMTTGPQDENEKTNIKLKSTLVKDL
jgi:hypothetical protein